MHTTRCFPLAPPSWGLVALPVLVAVLVHLGLVATHVAKLGGDVSVLVGVNDGRMGHAPYKHITQSLGPGGYDGMFYYAIARRPWVLHVQGVDAPAARHLRVLFPLLCWTVTGGEGRLLIYAMPALNLALIGALAYLGAMLALSVGRSPWWGLGLTLAVNVAIPAMRDLTDCLSTLAAAGLLIAWLTRAAAPVVTLWAAAAVFSREQNLALVVLVALESLVTTRKANVVGLAAVVAAWVGWVGLLWGAYGTRPFLPAQGNFTALPLGGLAYGWTHLGGPAHATRLALGNATSLFHWSALLATAGVLCWRIPDLRVRAFLVVALGFALMAGPSIYEDLMSYRRVLVWLPLGIWVAAIHTGRTWPLTVLAPAPLWSIAAALKYV